MKRFFALCISCAMFFFIPASSGFAQQRPEEGNATRFASETTTFAVSHATLPISTWVRITNLENGKRLRAIVSDRIPLDPNRILDVSEIVAKELEMNETGFTNIRIEMADAPLFVEDEDSVPEIMAVTVGDDSKPSAPLPPARTQNPVAQSDIPRISVSVLEAVTEPDVSIKVLVTINGQEYVLELPGNAGTSSASSRSNANASSSASSVAGATSFCGVKVIPKMPDPRGGGVFRVQVGSFSNTALAQECFDRLTSNGLKPSFERFGKMHRVVLSGIKAGDMVQVVQRLGDAGVAEAWLRREN